MSRGTIRLVKSTAPPRGWRRMLIFSLALHLAGFGAAIGLPRLLPRAGPGNPVYVVDLVSLPAPAPIRRRGGERAAPREMSAPPAAPKEEKPIPIPDRPKPTPEPKKEIPRPEPKKEVPKPEPKKPAEPPPESAPPEPAKSEPATAAGAGAERGPLDGAGPASAIGGTGSATIGVPGGEGTLLGDAYTFYFALLRRRIEMSWQKPIYPPEFTDRRTLVVTVRLGLSSGGRVTALELLTPSGYDALDRSILRAVREAQPFPPFPPQITRSSITVPVEFVLRAPE